ncbi:MAG: hypothetical protein ACI8RZ_003699 [Myxococcota bacterium]|jgi:hypothetical protein
MFPGLDYKIRTPPPSSGSRMPEPTEHLIRYRISSQHHLPIIQDATDWMSAIGAALHGLGRIGGIRRMACEQMPNGDIIINDLTNRLRYVVQILPPPSTEYDDDEVTEMVMRLPL